MFIKRIFAWISDYLLLKFSPAYRHRRWVEKLYMESLKATWLNGGDPEVVCLKRGL